MRDFARWLQCELYRLAGGGIITLPSGQYYLSSPILLSPGMNNISIVGNNTQIIALESVGLGPMIYIHQSDNIEFSGIVFDARNCAALRSVLFDGCSGITVNNCSFLGGISCLEMKTCTTVTCSDLIVGATSDQGPGNGRGVYFTLSTSGITLDGVRPYDSSLRHLVSLEDNVENAMLTDLATETSQTFACLDLHGKLEGNASVGSVTATGCAGRVNCGNPDHTNGSHLTLLNHDCQGKSIIVYPNANLRYQNIVTGPGGGISDESSGTATITNLGEPE